jgi:hypothetical protein
MEPPGTLLMPLLPYQKEGLGWLYNQETQSETFGGILADGTRLTQQRCVLCIDRDLRCFVFAEMGMGKTVQAISLLLANRPDPRDARQLEVWRGADDRNGVTSGPNARGGTLVVLPVIAMGQWQAEIARFTSAGALRVKVFHGSQRLDALDDFRAADVVLTSYKTLEAAYRRQTAGSKVDCRVCGKKFYAEKLRVHRTYFCGDTSRRTEAQAKTQKKKGARVTVTKEEDRSSEEEEEDEVDKQKRLIKELKETQSSAAAAKRQNKNAGKSRAVVKKCVTSNDLLSEEEEDVVMVGRRKREIAEVKSKPDKGRKAGKQEVGADNAGRPSRVRARTRVNYQESSDFEEEVETSSPVKRERIATKVPYSSKKRGREQEYEEEEEDSSFAEDEDSDEEEEEEEDDGVENVAEVGALKASRGSLRFKGKQALVEDVQLEFDIREAQRKAPRAVASALHQVSWFRVVLDEAHMIKDRSSSTSRAVFNLDAVYK